MQATGSVPVLQNKAPEADCTVRSGSVSPSDAPGATPDAGWAGDIRAVKWRTEEGKAHDGCKGKSNPAHSL